MSDNFFLKHQQSIRTSTSVYRNQMFLGKGGSGVTFFVTCVEGDLKGLNFALKLFYKISDQERQEKFLNEIELYRSLRHPAIVSLHDDGIFEADECRKYPFAVIEFIESNLHQQLVAHNGRIPRYLSLRYLMNVCSAVKYLHSFEQPIVHRDIKPANILLAGGMARLGDLGLAKAMGEASRGADWASGYVAFPKHYRTPELIKYARSEIQAIPPASDIFQLGTLAYELITSYNPQLPWQSITEDVRLDVRRIFDFCGDRLSALIGAMLDFNPANRPNISEVLQELTLINIDVCNRTKTSLGIMV